MFNEADAAMIMRQLFSVISYCNSKRICHRDMKPENILVDMKHKQVKVIDFGAG